MKQVSTDVVLPIEAKQCRKRLMLVRSVNQRTVDSLVRVSRKRTREMIPTELFGCD